MEELKPLRRIIIKQLKEGSWTKHIKGFYNDHFFFYEEGGRYKLTLRNKDKGRLEGDTIYVSDILNIYYFYYLMFFFVKKSINKNKLRIKNKKLIEVSSDFLSRNKDLDRDSKINEILN
jgi:hypothetical protein